MKCSWRSLKILLAQKFILGADYVMYHEIIENILNVNKNCIYRRTGTNRTKENGTGNREQGIHEEWNICSQALSAIKILIIKYALNY